MERLRRRPSSCSEEDEGWAAPVILPSLVQRVDEGRERRVVSSPSPQHIRKSISGTRFFLVRPLMASFICIKDFPQDLCMHAWHKFTSITGRPWEIQLLL
jgi:hypothetical protein